MKKRLVRVANDGRELRHSSINYEIDVNEGT